MLDLGKEAGCLDHLEFDQKARRKYLNCGHKVD